KIDADGSGCLINRASKNYRIADRSFCQNRNGRDGDALVSDSNADLVADLINRIDQTSSGALDLFAHAVAGTFDRISSAIAQTQPERHSADVEMLHLGNRVGLQDLGMSIYISN